MTERGTPEQQPEPADLPEPEQLPAPADIPEPPEPPRRQSRWATVLATLERLLYIAVTIAVGWAVYFFLLARITRGFEQVWIFLPVWLIAAYALLPRIHKILTDWYLPDYFIGRTRTGDGVLGDPVNLALMGSREDLRAAMVAAGWTQADPITLRTSWRTFTSTLLGRSYPEAPVSNLYVFGRKQDLAYQREIEGNPRKRHHVRFWQCPPGWKLPGGFDAEWVAAGTYDKSVGLSLFTFQITHKIADRTDEERDFIITTLRSAGAVESVHVIRHFSSGYHHRNGGGDAIRTDGHLPIVYLRQVPAVPPPPPSKLSGGTRPQP